MRDLIIERPQHRNKSQKYGQQILTLAIWTFFLYLIRPLLTIFAWFLGFSLISETMIEEGGWHPLVDMLGWYAVIVAAIAVVFIGWALLNLVRFRGKERRRRAPNVGLADMALRFGVDSAALAHWRRSQVLEMMHDGEGNIVRIYLLNTDPRGGSAAASASKGEAMVNAV